MNRLNQKPIVSALSAGDYVTAIVNGKVVRLEAVALLNQYGGPSGTLAPADADPEPAVPSWFFGTGPGNYTNLGINTTADIVFLVWDGSAWSAVEHTVDTAAIEANVEAAVSAKAEAEAIQLLRLHDPNLTFAGFAFVGQATPTPTADTAYIAAESGTIFGIAGVVKGQIIKGDGSGFEVENLKISNIHLKLNDIPNFRTNNLSNNPLYVQSGSYSTTGIYTPSSNWLSLKKQKLINYNEQTLSGIGVLNSPNLRIAFFDINDNFISGIVATGDAADVTFTPPTIADTFAINVAVGTNVGLNPSESPYVTTVMLNEGASSLPFEQYLVDVLSKIDTNTENIETNRVSIRNIPEMPKFRTNNLTNNPDYLVGGSFQTNGSFAPSSNWLALGKQTIRNFNEQTLSGIGAIPDTVLRIIFFDENGTVISYQLSDGTAEDITFTPPSNADTFAINVAVGSGVGATPSNSSYATSVMLNEGDTALPFEYYFLTTPVVKENTIYVSLTGDDDNIGISESLAVATISKASELVSDSGEIIMLEGDYIDQSFSLSDLRNLKAKTGDRVRLLYGDRITSASLVGGTTRVYEATYATAIISGYYLYQHDIEDEDTVIDIAERHPLHRGRRTRLSSTRLYEASSVAEIEAETTKLMYLQDGSTLYFSKLSGSDLSTNPIIIPSTSPLVGTSEKTVNISGIDILYKTVTTTNLSGKFSNVSVGFTNLGGSIIYDESLSLVFENCEVYACRNDGFNGHTNTAPTYDLAKQTNVTFINCYSHDNGDDGESSHEYTEVHHIGGLYEYNGSGITPASGAHCVCENVICRQNGHWDWLRDATGSGFSAQGASLDGGVGTNIYCFNCLSENNKIGFQGEDLSSKFINCISKNNTIDFGTGEQINCLII